MLGQVVRDETTGELTIRSLAGASASGLPVGSILALHTTRVPGGYLPCNGTAFDTEQYPALYTVLRSDHLPDLREMNLVGIGSNSTADIAVHDTYSLGQFKDDQIADTVGTISGTCTGVQISTSKAPSTSVRTGATTHGKNYGVFFVIKALTGVVELDDAEVYSQVVALLEQKYMETDKPSWVYNGLLVKYDLESGTFVPVETPQSSGLALTATVVDGTKHDYLYKVNGNLYTQNKEIGTPPSSYTTLVETQIDTGVIYYGDNFYYYDGTNYYTVGSFSTTGVLTSSIITDADLIATLEAQTTYPLILADYQTVQADYSYCWTTLDKSLDELTNVSINNATACQVLEFDGTNWVNSDKVCCAAIGTQLIGYNPTTKRFVLPTGCATVNSSNTGVNIDVNTGSSCSSLTVEKSGVTSYTVNASGDCEGYAQLLLRCPTSVVCGGTATLSAGYNSDNDTHSSRVQLTKDCAKLASTGTVCVQNDTTSIVLAEDDVAINADTICLNGNTYGNFCGIACCALRACCVVIGCKSDTGNYPLVLAESTGNGTAKCIFTDSDCAIFFNPTSNTLTTCTVKGASGMLVGSPSGCTSSSTGANGVCLGLGSAELYDATPFIDLHYNRYCGDYSTRLINSTQGRTDLIVNNGTGCTAATATGNFCFCSNGYLYGNVCGNICGNATYSVCSGCYWCDLCDTKNCDRNLVVSTGAGGTITEHGVSTCCSLTFNPATGVMKSSVSGITGQCAGYVCSLTYTGATCRYILLDLGANYEAQKIDIIQYNNRSQIVTACGGSLFYNNDRYGAQAIYQPSSRTARCIWIKYVGYITPRIISTFPVCIICDTTTEPSGATWNGGIKDSTQCVISNGNSVSLYPTFVSAYSTTSGCGCDTTMYVDNGGNISYNPSTNVLTVPTVCGNLCGTATNADKIKRYPWSSAYDFDVSLTNGISAACETWYVSCSCRLRYCNTTGALRVTDSNGCTSGSIYTSLMYIDGRTWYVNDWTISCV